MNAFATVVLALAVASASAIPLGHFNHEAHKPSGLVSATHDGALIAGPAGSVHTDNGLHGHGAGAKVSGPSGDVDTHGGHAKITGPGHDSYEHNDYSGSEGHYVESAAHLNGHGSHEVVVAGHSGDAIIVGPKGHVTVVGPTHHATLVAPVAHHTWGHQASAHGHHGW